MTRRVVAGVMVVLVGPWTRLDLLVSMCRWGASCGRECICQTNSEATGPGRFGRQTWSENIYAFDRRLQHWGTVRQLPGNDATAIRRQDTRGK